jgi:hypothetical protein
MLERDIYFFINDRAVVSKWPVRGLPQPWPLLLDGSWRIFFRHAVCLKLIYHFSVN